MTAIVTFDPTNINRVVSRLSGPKTREAWHHRMAHKLEPLLRAAGGTLPEKIRYSTGWLGRGTSKKAIGVCYRPEASADGTTEILISPAIGDAFNAADTLAHELVHACPESGKGHGKQFKKLALAFGLVGKMRSAGAGPELAEKIRGFIEEIGPYPHAELQSAEAADKPKKQNTRMIKVACPECEAAGTPYICRMSQTTIDRGTPTCPCGSHMVAESAEDEGED
jgi:hypothetical protein